MTRIRLLVQPPGAPGCVAILPEHKTYNQGIDDGPILFQSDHDQEALAKALGMPDSVGFRGFWWWLNDHDGETFGDPGYLDQGGG